MMHLLKNKSSEEISPLKIRSYSTIFIIGCVVINYLILPYIRTNRFIDMGILKGFTLSIFVGAIFHVALISCCYYSSRKRFSTKRMLIIWGLIILLPKLLFRCFHWQATIISLPDMLCRATTVILTCCFFAVPLIKVRVLAGTFLPIILLTFILGWSFWTNKLSFGTFTGRIEEGQTILKTEFESMGDMLQVEMLHSKYILLYMWITNCGYCFESLPQLQSYYNDFANNPDIQIYAVHGWTNNENEETGAVELERRGYNFPCLSVHYKDSFLIKSQVTVYPRFLVKFRAVLCAKSIHLS